MAHTLSQAELFRFQQAFTNWDTTGEGTVRWRHLCRVMEELGQNPSQEFQAMCDRADAVDGPVTFEEFLTITIGPPWETIRPDPENELNRVMAEFDDGSGYIPLQDLMRIVHEYLQAHGYHFTDGDLLDIYRQVIDGSVCASAGGTLSPESTWKVIEKELADLRKGRSRENVDSEATGWASRLARYSRRKCCELFARLRLVRPGLGRRFPQLRARLARRNGDSGADQDRTGDDGESTGETARVIILTVEDLGGEQLMCEAVASTWSVQALQQHIETAVGVPAHRQFLFLATDDGLRHELCPNDDCLYKAGVVDGSTLVLAVKGEVKLDYRTFVSRFMDLEF